MDSNPRHLTVPLSRLSRRAAVLGIGGYLAAGLPGCGGGGGGGGGGGSVHLGAVLMAFFAASTTRAQAVMSNRRGDAVTLWTGSGNALAQALYQVRGRTVRVYFSGGAIVRIVDEESGEFVTVTVVDDDRTDYNWYSASGAWKNGFAVLRNAGGGFSVAAIVSGPALQGMQLSGTLSGPLVASFTLLPDAGGASGLGTLHPLTSGSTLLFTRGSTVASRFLPHRRLPAMLLGTAHAGDEGPPPWFRQRQVLVAFLLLAGALTLGVQLSPMAELAAAAVLAYAAYFAYGSLLGLGAVRVGHLFDAILGDALDAFEAGGDPMANVRANISAYMLAPTIALLQLALLATVVARLASLRHGTLSSLLLRDPAGLQPITGGPPAGETAMSGLMVDSGGFTWQVTATYQPALKGLSWDTGTSGASRVRGAGSGGSGTYSVTDGATTQNGTYTVEERALGACRTQQSSGGQGTFTNSYDMGRDAGSFDLSYQMYNIPDRLDVRGSTGQLLYSTGGLVSGGQTVSIPFSGGRIVHVLISAPTSGTVWDYDIGCPA